MSGRPSNEDKLEPQEGSVDQHTLSPVAAKDQEDEGGTPHHLTPLSWFEHLKTRKKILKSQEAESPKPDSSYNYLEEMETGEDRGCPGPPKPLAPKAGPATKGQAGDGPGPEPAEPPLAPGTERNAMELEKVRMEFELTRLKYLHEENERQRQHEEVMEQLQQQATPRPFSGGLQDLLLPQNQFAMFLYCFIFIHIIYVAKEMVFFLFSKHYLFCIAAILLCLIKTLWSYFQVPLLSPSLGTPMLECH